MRVIERAPTRTAPRDLPRVDGQTSAIPVAWLAFGIGAALGTVVFHAWVLARSGTPSGIDTGNWLAFGNGLLGNNVKAGGLAYPPLVPLLVALAARAFGSTAGVALVGAIAASMPALGVFLVLRWGGLGSWAIVLAAFVLPQPALGEMAAWGGFPQLIAAPFVVIGLWLLDRSLQSHDRRALVGAAAAGALVLATSHFAAIGGLIAAVVMVANRVMIPISTRGAVVRRAAAVAGLTSLFALPLVPVYERLVPAVFGAREVGLSTASITLAGLSDRSLAIHGIVTAALIVGVACAVVGVAAPRQDFRDGLWSVNLALVIGAASTILLTREPRVLYEIPLVGAIGAGTCIRRFKSWHDRTPDTWMRRGATAFISVGVAVAVSLVTFAGVGQFEKDQKTYAILSGHLVAALDWLRWNTPPDAIVGVTDLDSTPLGWWVEGLGQRRTLMESPSKWLVFPEEREIAAEAHRVFMTFERNVRTGFGEARRIGIDYLLIPKRSSTYQLARIELKVDEIRPSFENKGVIILQVPRSTT